jgi:hypothetical protein
MGPRTECAYFKGRNPKLPVGLAAARREGRKLGVKKELIMVRLEKNDPLMLARQLPSKPLR